MFNLYFPKRRRAFRCAFQRILRGVLNSVKTLYVYTSCQKAVTEEWLSVLIWNYREMLGEINVRVD